MLGIFQISYKGVTITSGDISSPMMIKLVSYILYHHKQKTTSRELVQNIWEIEELENHKGVLKNLVYRLRALMRKYWPSDNFIVTDYDGYHWNPDIPVFLDTDIFEQGNVIMNEPTDACRMALLLDLYKGKFMTECDELYWVMYMQVYYQNKLTHLVASYCDVLKHRNDYIKIVDITQKLIKIDTMEEEFHYWLIYALIKQKKFAQASKMYGEAIRCIYGDEDDEVSERMKYLSRLIELGDKAAEIGYDDLIHKILNSSNGAYILAKKEEMLSAVININLHHKKTPAEAFEYKWSYYAEIFEKVLLNTVRVNDIIIKNNEFEYNIVLKHCDESGGENFLSRLKHEFIRELTTRNKKIIEFSSKIIVLCIKSN